MPQISNFLAAAYNLTDSDKFDACVEDNYKRNPTYLFARIEYARQCMDKNEPGKIPEIFKAGGDLKVLYPHRNRFHISEFIAFNAVMCRYYHTIGERQAAEVMFESLEKLAPEHPATIQARHCMKETLLEKLHKNLKLINSGNRPQQSSNEDKLSSFEA